MNPFATKQLGKTGLRLPALGMGGATLGNIFGVIDDKQSDATLEAAWDAGIRFYDTSPWYGRGLSEQRFGRALYRRPRDEVILSTKVGRLFTDFFLVALPYTLAEQPVLDAEFSLLEKRGIGVVIGGVFASGILATGPVPGARYNYHEPTAAEAEHVRRIQQVCARYDVPLAAAALQFTLHHPVVASVIPGAFAPHHPTQNVETMRADIPAGLWHDLKRDGLLREDAPTP